MQPLRRLHFDAWLALYCSELNSVLTQLGKTPPDQQQRSLELIRQNDWPTTMATSCAFNCFCSPTFSALLNSRTNRNG
ncbi:hypothetical protein niasHS_013681 [Heterodera schachtii]|uniref:Uncharacterized protein n=1 Tax=Heterodera schachtii TaxID=97005 RepID=A0ABD2I7P0_HETSC